MMRYLYVIFILGIFQLGLESQFDLQNSIFNLNDDNLDEFIHFAESTESSILLEVYSDSCKYCLKFGPMFEEAAKTIAADKEYNILFARIEGKENPKVIDKYDVKGYPSLYFFTPKENYIPFQYLLEEYSTEEVYKAIRVSLGSSIEVKSHNQFIQVYEKEKDPFILGIFKDKSELQSAFDNFRKYFPSLKIFYTYDFNNFVKKFSLNEKDAPIVTLVKNPKFYDAPFLVPYNKNIDVKDFIVQNYLSPIELCSNLTDFVNGQSKHPKGILYLDLGNIPKENSKKIFNGFSIVTKIFMSKIDFCIMNADLRIEKYEKMELEPEGTFYIYANNRKYRLLDKLIQDANLNITALTQFINNFLEGKVKYYRKSNPVNPDLLSEPLKYILGADYDEVVSDPSIDIYVRISDKMLIRQEEAYQGMMAWLNLSYEFNQSKIKIVLGEIDTCDNDIPEEIEPLVDPLTSIFAYLRSNKSNPIKYKGNTGSMDDLRKWIQKLSPDLGITTPKPKEKEKKATKSEDL